MPTRKTIRSINSDVDNEIKIFAESFTRSFLQKETCSQIYCIFDKIAREAVWLQ